MTSELRARLREREAIGFTLVEVVTAMVILGILAMAMIAIVLAAQAQSVTNRDRVAASNLAARELALVRQEFFDSDEGPLAVADAGVVTNPHPLAGGSTGDPLVVDGTAYTVVRSPAWNVTGSGGAPACSGGSIVAYPTLTVTVTVTWPHMGQVKPVVTQGTLAPDKDDGASPTDSYVAVSVKDPAGDPLVGVQLDAGGQSASSDGSGCAVVKVDPDSGGTEYQVTVAGNRYVDISGEQHPSKTTGRISPGTIYTGMRFTLAEPATLRIKVERQDGGTVHDADVAGLSATLVAAESSGGEATSVHKLTGVVTTISGLWPTVYGAYLGDSAPPDGYDSATLVSGGTATVTVSYQVLEVHVHDVIDGASTVVAVPASTDVEDCTTGLTAPVSGGKATLSLAAGSYDFYAVGDTYGCSPGPSGVALDVTLADVYWSTSKIGLTGAPSDGKIWAVEKVRSGLSSPATCPSNSDVDGDLADIAVNVSGARDGTKTLPAGTWYLFATDGDVDGACASFPAAINPVAVRYNGTTTVSWDYPKAALTLTSMTRDAYLVVSTKDDVSCSASTATTSGDSWVSDNAASRWSAEATVTVPRPGSGTTTYYAYQWRKSGSFWDPAGCDAAGKFVVGPATAQLSKRANNSSEGP